MKKIVLLMALLLSATLAPLALPAAAQVGERERAANTALGRRIDKDGSGSNILPPGVTGLSRRLDTRLRTRLDTRIDRQAKGRADAAYAYRAPVDDGTRKAPAPDIVRRPVSVVTPDPDISDTGHSTMNGGSR